jgi:uncharacterized membrane protein
MCPTSLAGTVPLDTYDVRFVEHHWLAYLHIGPGIDYLLGAPLQLSHRFRSRHYTFHRRLGRVLAGAALMSGVFALVFGILYPFRGIVETAAVVVFGLWFLACLILAIRAIRGDDMVHHRRWDDPGVRGRCRGRHDSDLAGHLRLLRPPQLRGCVRTDLLQ